MFAGVIQRFWYCCTSSCFTSAVSIVLLLQLLQFTRFILTITNKSLFLFRSLQRCLFRRQFKRDCIITITGYQSSAFFIGRKSVIFLIIYFQLTVVVDMFRQYKPFVSCSSSHVFQFSPFHAFQICLLIVLEHSYHCQQLVFNSNFSP